MGGGLEIQPCGAISLTEAYGAARQCLYMKGHTGPHSWEWGRWSSTLG